MGIIMSWIVSGVLVASLVLGLVILLALSINLSAKQITGHYLFRITLETYVKKDDDEGERNEY